MRRKERRARAYVARAAENGRANERAGAAVGPSLSVGRPLSKPHVCGGNKFSPTHSLARHRPEGADARTTRTVVKVKDGVKASERASDRFQRGGGGAERVERNQILFGVGRKL